MNTRLYTAIIYFHLVSVVLTNYIFNDHPNDFMARDILNLAKNRISGSKKFYKGSNNQNVKLINQRTVDLHFKAQRTSPSAFATGPVKYNTFNPISRNAALPYNHRQLSTVHDPVIKRQNNINQKLLPNNGMYDDVKSTTNRSETFSINNKNSNVIKGNNYDSQVNEHFQKIQKKFDCDKEHNIDNQHSSSSEEDTHNRLQKEYRDGSRNSNNVKSDRDRLATRANEDRQQMYNNLPKQEEYAKRHIMGQQKNDKQNTIGIENKKPVSFKPEAKRPSNLKANNLDRSDFLGRLGRYGLNSKTKTRPYAVFYIMNQDNFDQNNGISEEVRSYVQEPVNYKRVEKNRNTERKTRKSSNYTVFRD